MWTGCGCGVDGRRETAEFRVKTSQARQRRAMTGAKNTGFPVVVVRVGPQGSAAGAKQGGGQSDVRLFGGPFGWCSQTVPVFFKKGLSQDCGGKSPGEQRYLFISWDDTVFRRSGAWGPTEAEWGVVKRGRPDPALGKRSSRAHFGCGTRLCSYARPEAWGYKRARSGAAVGCAESSYVKEN